MNNPTFRRTPLLSFAIFLLPAVLVVTFKGLPAHGQNADGSADLELRKGQSLMGMHRYEDALKSFKHANDLRNKTCAECLYDMAQAYEGLGAHKNAIESCDKAFDLAAGDKRFQASILNVKGIAQQALAENKDQKRLQEAEATFRQGLALGVDLPTLHFNLGFTLLQENRDAEGIAELKKYLELENDGSNAASAQKLIENPRRAREAFAPDFSFTTADGEYVSADDLRGKVVLLDFWGTWCPPCVQSVPSLRDMNKRYAKEKSFMLISISVHDEEDKWRAFTAQNQMVWRQTLDRDGKIQRAFDVHRFPTYILIDHEGIVRFRASGYGFDREATLVDAIHKAMKTLAKSTPSE